MIAPYIVVFAISTILVGIAGSKLNQSRIVRWTFASLAVLVVAVFAGVRDYEVGGPDVSIYGNKVFAAMLQTERFGDIMNYATDRGVDGEAGYYFLNWIVSRFTNDAHVFYGLLAAFCAGVIVVAVMLLRNYGPPVVMWLAYMLTAYVEGFNLLRQSPSLALAVLGVAIILRGRPWLALAVGASGLLFHNSAVVFLVMWAIAFYLRSRTGNLTRPIWTVLIVSLLALAAVAPVIDILSNALADTKYQEYLSDDARGGRAFGIDALYRAIPIVAGIWALRATRERPALDVRTSKYVRPGALRGSTTLLTRPVMQETSAIDTTARRALIIVLMLLSLELILLPVREISYPFYRLLAYFGYLRIIGYGLIVGMVTRNRLAAGLVAVAFSAAYFALIVLERNEAFYSSAILDSWF